MAQKCMVNTIYTIFSFHITDCPHCIETFTSEPARVAHIKANHHYIKCLKCNIHTIDYYKHIQSKEHRTRRSIHIFISNISLLSNIDTSSVNNNNISSNNNSSTKESNRHIDDSNVDEYDDTDNGVESNQITNSDIDNNLLETNTYYDNEEDGGYNEDDDNDEDDNQNTDSNNNNNLTISDDTAKIPKVLREHSVSFEEIEEQVREGIKKMQFKRYLQERCGLFFLIYINSFSDIHKFLQENKFFPYESQEELHIHQKWTEFVNSPSKSQSKLDDVLCIQCGILYIDLFRVALFLNFAILFDIFRYNS